MARSMWVGGGGVWGKDKSKFYFHIDVLHIHTIHFLCTNILSCQKFRNIYLHFNQTNATEKLLLLRTAKASLQFQIIKTSWLRKTSAAKGNVCWIFFNVGKEFKALCGSGYLLKMFILDTMKFFYNWPFCGLGQKVNLSAMLSVG